jgi:hypothetical protein
MSRQSGADRAEYRDRPSTHLKAQRLEGEPDRTDGKAVIDLRTAKSVSGARDGGQAHHAHCAVGAPCLIDELPLSRL